MTHLGGSLIGDHPPSIIDRSQVIAHFDVRSRRGRWRCRTLPGAIFADAAKEETAV
jgi:hypothetical protein